MAITIPIIMGELISFHPPAFRYMKDEYINSFFDNGSLRLSSFSRFMKLDDEQRQDEMEGITLFIHKNHDNGGQTFVSWVGHGIKAYVMSASMNLSMNLLNTFNSDAVFEISNPIGFANAVAKRIPDFQRLVIGPCFYQRIKIIERDLGHIDTKNIEKQKEFIRDAMLKSAGWNPYFQKPVRYANQSEFRFIWLTNNQANEFLDIEVPEALPFCKKVTIEGGIFMDENLIPKDPGPPDQYIQFDD